MESIVANFTIHSMLSIELVRVVYKLELVVSVCLLTGLIMIILPLVLLFLADVGGYIYLKYTNKISV